MTSLQEHQSYRLDAPNFAYICCKDVGMMLHCTQTTAARPDPLLGARPARVLVNVHAEQASRDTLVI